jgi:hypothetical protein
MTLFFKITAMPVLHVKNMRNLQNSLELLVSNNPARTCFVREEIKAQGYKVVFPKLHS